MPLTWLESKFHFIHVTSLKENFGGKQLFHNSGKTTRLCYSPSNGVFMSSFFCFFSENLFILLFCGCLCVHLTVLWLSVCSSLCFVVVFVFILLFCGCLLVCLSVLWLSVSLSFCFVVVC